MKSYLNQLIFQPGDITTLKEATEESHDIDQQTFDQALFTLYQEKKIRLTKEVKSTEEMSLVE